ARPRIRFSFRRTPHCPPNRVRRRRPRRPTTLGTPRCGTPSPTARTARRHRRRRSRRPLQYYRVPYHPVPCHPARCRPVVDPADLDVVTRQLGREPRGVLDIAYRCPNGEPGVVKTAPKLPDGTPFPTLYSLTHPALTAAASRLETPGMMRDMTQRLQSDPELAAAYRRGPQRHPGGGGGIQA